MGFLDKAKGLADQAMAKADEAMNSATTASPSKQGEAYLHDLGVLAYLESVGRAPADLDEQRQRCLSGLGQIESHAPLNLAMTSVAPPPPGAAAGVTAPPPPPGAAVSAPPPPPGAVAPPPPGAVAPPATRRGGAASCPWRDRASSAPGGRRAAAPALGRLTRSPPGPLANGSTVIPPPFTTSSRAQWFGRLSSRESSS